MTTNASSHTSDTFLVALDWRPPWWSLVLRGGAALVLAALAFLWPGITLLALVLLFGAFAVVDGLLALLSAFQRNGRFAAPFAQGLLGLAVGLVVLLWPDVGGLALVLLIGAWAVVTGVLELVAAVRLRRHVRGEWLLGASGALSILLGVAIVAFPSGGALAISWLIGAYALLGGVTLLALGLRLRRLERAPDDARGPGAEPAHSH